MGKKPLSFLEQADALERENKQLKESLDAYKKLADTVVKAELGMDLKAVKKLLEKGDERHLIESIFEEKICNYFGLNTDEDKEDFLQIMLTQSSLNHFKKERQKKDVEAAQQDS